MQPLSHKITECSIQSHIAAKIRTLHLIIICMEMIKNNAPTHESLMHHD